MKKLHTPVLILLLFTTGPASGAMFKCTDAGGQVSYQQTPCADSTGAATQIAPRNDAPKDPLPMTKGNKKLFQFYSIYERQTVIVEACNRRGSSYAGEITEAYQRFYDNGEATIEKGREIAKRGLVGLPSSEISSKQRESAAQKRIELRGTPLEDIEQLCRSNAAKLRRLAGIVPRQVIGYEEGDIDAVADD